MAKRLIPYIQVSPRFYLFEFDAVLDALKEALQNRDADEGVKQAPNESPRMDLSFRGPFFELLVSY